MNKKRKRRRLTTFGKIFFTVIIVVPILILGFFFFPHTVKLEYKVEDNGKLVEKVDEVKFLGFKGFEFPELKYENYELDSWRDKDGHVVENTKWLNSQTLTAQISPKEFPIEYDDETKDLMDNLPKSYTYGKSVDLTKYKPEKEGAEFVRWLVNGKDLDEIPAGTSGPVLLTAMFSDKTYSIKYENIEDATMPEAYVDTREAGEAINNLPTPTRNGYTFTGWYEDSDLTKKVESISADENSDVVLYAGWAENYVPEYTEPAEQPLEDWQIEEQRLQEYYNYNPTW